MQFLPGLIQKEREWIRKLSVFLFLWSSIFLIRHRVTRINLANTSTAGGFIYRETDTRTCLSHTLCTPKHMSTYLQMNINTLALTSMHLHKGEITHRGQYEYEKSYLCIDCLQRLFPRPLALLLWCCAIVHHCSGVLHHPVHSQPPLSPTQTNTCTHKPTIKARI